MIGNCGQFGLVANVFTYAYVSIESINCIILLSLALNAILLTSSVDAYASRF